MYSVSQASSEKSEVGVSLRRSALSSPPRRSFSFPAGRGKAAALSDGSFDLNGQKDDRRSTDYSGGSAYMQCQNYHHTQNMVCRSVLLIFGKRLLTGCLLPDWELHWA
ncbi:hypothetical protein XENORESO_007446 [Xenotaenia resolanae]|uniref:Uncharacterized protein n=1 Tax=Xenotaenia resolanae TaxID=208358 RepID=A0ABV0WVN3_9TELE